MDVFARNAVDSSAQLRDPAATPGLSNSSALAAALPGGHSRKETRNMVEWIYETDHYRKAYEGKKMTPGNLEKQYLQIAANRQCRFSPTLFTFLAQ